MNRNDYKEQIKDDIRDYIDANIDLSEWWDTEEYDREKLEEKLNEDLWMEDSVTGNASGSYTFSTWQAEENIAHALDLIEEVAEAFGIEPTVSSGYEHGAEWWDVSIRCYLLGECISEVLDEIFSPVLVF